MNDTPHGKKILCLDFDGVLHSHKSGWITASFIPDPSVAGAFEFLYEAVDEFDVQIFSSRSNQEGGIKTMVTWFEYWATRELTNDDPHYKANRVINKICYRKEAFPLVKPPAFIGLDDRVLTFDGSFPEIEDLKAFKPWNKR